MKEFNPHKFKFNPYLEDLYQSDKPLIIYKVKNGYNLYTNFSVEEDVSLNKKMKNCIALGIDQIFEYWKRRNNKINLLIDKSPTHYEYLKKIIYKRK